ncbi:MAG: hypothetical protein LKK00_08410 [Intestinimonas sp.]|nr:hypothetical protein [Intestinimonas sp.]
MNTKNRSKSVVIISTIISKIQIILGGLLILIFTISLIGLIDAPDTFSLIIEIILLILSVFLLYKGINRGKLIKLFKNYVQRLSTDCTHSISLLADNTGTSVDVVKSNLQKMISKNYFLNAYIDEKRNCIVFPQAGETEPTVSSESSAADSDVEYQTVICKGCGAENKIPIGSTRECEYCGSLLE